MQCSIEAVKWQAFWEFHPPEQFSDALGYIQQMQEALINKDREKCNQLKGDFCIETKDLSEKFYNFYISLLQAIRDLSVLGDHH